MTKSTPEDRISDLEEAFRRLNNDLEERLNPGRLSSSKVFKSDYLGEVKKERKIKKERHEGN